MHQSHPAFIELRKDLIETHTNKVYQQRLNVMKNGQPLEYTVSKGLWKENQKLKVSLSADNKFLILRDGQDVVTDTWPLSLIVCVRPGTDEKRIRQPEKSLILFMQKKEAWDHDECGPEVAEFMRRTSTIPRDRDHRPILVAPTEQTCTHWMDGFCFLKKYNRESECFAEDLNNLVELELRMRLLGLDWSVVPETPIPPPSTYPDTSTLPF
ncbi:Engulfment and cell motility protein 3 [Sparganum proliferum]